MAAGVDSAIVAAAEVDSAIVAAAVGAAHLTRSYVDDLERPRTRSREVGRAGVGRSGGGGVESERTAQLGEELLLALVRHAVGHADGDRGLVGELPRLVVGEARGRLVERDRAEGHAPGERVEVGGAERTAERLDAVLLLGRRGAVGEGCHEGDREDRFAVLLVHFAPSFLAPGSKSSESELTQ